MPYREQCHMLIHTMFMWNIMFLSVRVASLWKAVHWPWACVKQSKQCSHTHHICSPHFFPFGIRTINIPVWARSLDAYSILMAFFQHRKVRTSVHRVAAGFTPHLCHQQVINLTHQNAKSCYITVEKGKGIIFFMRLASTGLLSIPGLALPASHASLEICLAANMLWKAPISYLGRSSMHQDNKPYLISLCSLMSQLKGLVLPLAMGLAERIVCRLVNTGLWRSWSTFRMLVLSHRRSRMRASRFPMSNGMSTTRWSVGIITHTHLQ